MDRRQGQTAHLAAPKTVHVGPKRNNAVMEQHGDATPRPGGERGVVTDESVSRYLQAVERADPAETPEPAAALAELLAARLEGTDAPRARRILESFAPTATVPSGEDQ